MPEASAQTALLRLLAWLSPAFPVGSFSYSHGLEQAVDAGTVADRDALRSWIASLLEHGSAWNDAVLFAEAWRTASAGEPIGDIAELAQALAGSAERHLETTAQGSAFTVAAGNWHQAQPFNLPANCPYCVAVAAVSAANGVPLEQALAAYLQAFVSNQLQAAIRLSLIGQADAAALLAGLEADILSVARRAARSSLDDLGSATIAAEIASMNHETQYSRLFRS
ncbi:urease accessory protein UreF [Mesorhizobium sp. CAU 1732]|uniref:urease accessory protein UreF n=1 Tax=Mesorhizobium sp. CAU 1732 TaxID=3140358 RepID=UPI00326143C4